MTNFHWRIRLPVYPRIRSCFRDQSSPAQVILIRDTYYNFNLYSKTDGGVDFNIFTSASAKEPSLSPEQNLQLSFKNNILLLTFSISLKTIAIAFSTIRQHKSFWCGSTVSTSVLSKICCRLDSRFSISVSVRITWEIASPYPALPCRCCSLSSTRQSLVSLRCCLLTFRLRWCSENRNILIDGW